MKINYLYFLLLSIIFFIYCGKKNKVDGFVGEPLSISGKLPDELKSLKYKWTLRKKPDKSSIEKNNISFTNNEESILIFTPDEEGYYEFAVSISWYGEIISTQLFPLLIGAQKDRTSNTSWDESDNSWLQNSEKQEIIKKIKPKEITRTNLNEQFFSSKYSSYYTVQVAAKKDKISAESLMKKMQSKGFNSYIQKFNKEKTNQLWYRVRVGSFSKKDSALIIAEKIKNTMSIDTWVDYVRETKE